MTFSLRSLFHSGAYLFLGSLGNALILFFQGIVVARTLGPASYGVWGVVVAYSAMTQALLSFRTEEPLTRYLVEYRQNGQMHRVQLLMQMALLADLGTRSVAFVVVVLAAPLVAGSIAGGETHLTVYWIYAFTVVFTCIDALWYCVVRDQKRFRFLAGFPACFAAIQFAVVVVLWLTGNLTLPVLASLVVLIALLRFVAKAAYLRRNLERTYGISLSQLLPRSLSWKLLVENARMLSAFWAFMRMTYISSVISSIVKNGDLLILGYFRADAEVGWYRLAKSMVNMIHMSAASLATVIYQEMSEWITRKEFRRARQAIGSLLKIWCPLVLGGVVVAIFLARPVIRFVYGEEFVAATAPFIILIVGVGIAMMLFWTRPMGLAMVRLRENLAMVALSSVFFVVAGLALVPRFGGNGMAAALAGAWAVGHLGMLWVVLKCAGGDTRETLVPGSE